jgi:hypothetical protein
MTDTKEFKRERRYILAKVKHLRPHDIQFLDSYLKSLEHPELQAVVVESDWSNYEDTWKAIEQVANGEYQSPYESVEQLQARCAELDKEVKKHKQIDFGNREFIDMLKDAVGELERERDALAAHVEHWKDISEQCAVAQTKVEACTIYEQANEHSTPQRSLAAHDAEVARKAITKAKETFVLGSNGNEDFQAGIDYCLDAYDKHLDRCAQRIEDGEL